MKFNDNVVPKFAYPSLEKFILRAMDSKVKVEQELGPIENLTEDELFRDAYAKIRAFMQNKMAQSAITEATARDMRNLAEDHGIFEPKWAQLGFPHITLNEAQVNQFIVSSISEDVCENLDPPWNYFVINLPDHAIPIVNKSAEGGQDYVKRILVRRYETRKEGEDWTWKFTLDSVNDRAVFTKGSIKTLFAHTNVLTKKDADAFFDEKDKTISELSDEEVASAARLIETVLRISFGTMIEMMIDKSHFKHRTVNYKAGFKKPFLKKAFPTPATANEYIFTKPIAVNYRDAVRDYLGGVRNSPTLRFLVRGHYRWQPHGPKSTLRKWTYIAPFWKGREHEEVAVRAHVLKDS